MGHYDGDFVEKSCPIRQALQFQFCPVMAFSSKISLWEKHDLVLGSGGDDARLVCA